MVKKLNKVNTDRESIFQIKIINILLDLRLITCTKISIYDIFIGLYNRLKKLNNGGIMDFVAIDFETANSHRDSVCSLGITVVKDNKIVEKRYWLIKPYPFRFDPINISIHGIREADVINEKEFDEVWPEIKPYLENKLVIAHNASFDFSVLRKTLDLYGIDYPKLNYCCTLVASKLFYRYLSNYKLNTVNKHLGYKFKHHHASEDATACANILINIAEELKIDNINEISNLVGFKLGYLNIGGYSPCSKVSSGVVSNRHKTYSEEDESSLFSSTTEFFKDKVVVFTGPLNSMSRIEGTRLINSLGGITRSSVTKKTNILITNTPNIDSLSPEQMSNKLRTAMCYRGRGQDILIINEEELESIIYGNIDNLTI